MSKKTAQEISQFLTKTAVALQAHCDDHPALQGLVNQINRKATSITKPAPEVAAGRVSLSYSDKAITVQKVPFMHRSKFYAWTQNLKEINGGESTYKKDVKANVLPLSAKEALMAKIADFFPGATVESV